MTWGNWWQDAFRTGCGYGDHFGALRSVHVTGPLQDVKYGNVRGLEVPHKGSRGENAGVAHLISMWCRLPCILGPLDQSVTN